MSFIVIFASLLIICDANPNPDPFKLNFDSYLGYPRLNIQENIGGKIVGFHGYLNGRGSLSSKGVDVDATAEAGTPFGLSARAQAKGEVTFDGKARGSLSAGLFNRGKHLALIGVSGFNDFRNKVRNGHVYYKVSRSLACIFRRC